MKKILIFYGRILYTENVTILPTSTLTNVNILKRFYAFLTICKLSFLSKNEDDFI